MSKTVKITKITNYGSAMSIFGNAIYVDDSGNRHEIRPGDAPPPERPYTDDTPIYKTDVLVTRGDGSMVLVSLPVDMPGFSFIGSGSLRYDDESLVTIHNFTEGSINGLSFATLSPSGEPVNVKIETFDAMPYTRYTVNIVPWEYRI